MGATTPRFAGWASGLNCLWLTGDMDGSQESIRQALEWAETIDHLGSLCHALDNAVLVALSEGLENRCLGLTPA